MGFKMRNNGVDLTMMKPFWIRMGRICLFPDPINIICDQRRAQGMPTMKQLLFEVTSLNYTKR